MIVDSPYFGYAISGLQNLSSPAVTLTHSSEHMLREAPSPMNDIGHYNISQQMTHGNQPMFEQGQDCPKILQVNVDDGIGSNAQLNNTFDNRTRTDDIKAPECDTNDVTSSNHPIADLRILKLRSIVFFKEIPPNLSDSSSLLVMDLVENNLTRRIPDSLGDLQAMARE
ncbi:hypothetical protein QYF36_001006 [Acer negundo]|nr:hypothetical protein QYF36_001006 [Acer negundo]